MIRSILAGCLMLCGVQPILAESFVIKPDSGEVKVWALKTNSWITVIDSHTVSTGDSIVSAENSSATIRLGSTTILHCKGSLNIALLGNAIDLRIDLIQGQIFLLREKPYTLNSITILAEGCSFSPIGTAAAFKHQKNSQPSVAVLRGSVRAQSASGETLVVPAGEFCTYDPAIAGFKSGKLPAPAIASLESWSGVKVESSPAPIAKADSASIDTTDSSAASENIAPADATTAPLSMSAAAQTTPLPMPANSVTDTAKSIPAQPAKPAQTEASAGSSGKVPAAALRSGEKKVEQPSSEKSKVAEGEEGEEGKSEKGEKGEAAPSKPAWGLSAGPVTVNNQQWTRVAFSGDIPIWKFGLGIDVEIFMNAEGQFDKKGWEFTRDTWARSVLRKIRYVRFGYEQDPLFVKLGGLDAVTLGYSFIMNNFSNTIHYPDQKLLGLQFYLNELTPVGLTLQTVVADFMDFKDDGGLLGARLGFKPVGFLEIPIVKGIKIAGTYVTDLNQYAPARRWDYSLTGTEWDRDQDGITDGTWQDTNNLKIHGTPLTAAERDTAIAKGVYDTLIEQKDQWASRETDAFSMVGADITVPILATKILTLDVYGQMGITLDDQDSNQIQGWGFGAPGVALGIGPLWARVEYRHTQGYFEPGYFGTYYLDERLERSPEVATKESRLADDTLNGVFGALGLDIMSAFKIEGSYQYLIGSSEEAIDHRFEVVGKVGEVIISKIPKLKRVEAYLEKTNIGRGGPTSEPKDAFFEKTPYFTWGFRLGFEVMPGAGILWDARYGWARDPNGGLIKNDNISIQASMTF